MSRPSTSQRMMSRPSTTSFGDLPVGPRSLDRPVSRGSAAGTVRVARRIQPGQTITDSAGGMITRPQSYVGDPEPELPRPVTLLGNSATRPRLDQAGSPVRYTILGSASEFQTERRARAEAQAAFGSPADGPFLEPPVTVVRGASGLSEVLGRASTANSKFRSTARRYAPIV
ncbi:hypothetical protein T492DRAFT_880930 [Pavlovales sp. CCMP2436]|nr:hypothetical protein T492DRAFT_880930 [Pavlovales sp. CCMP2436]